MLVSRSKVVPGTAFDRTESVTSNEESGRAESGPRAETVSIDWHIRESILAGLAKRGIALNDDLTLDVCERAVTVRGRVDSYYQRQLIVHSIRLVPGVRELTDAVECFRAAVPGGGAM